MAVRVRFFAAMQGRQAYSYPSMRPRRTLKASKGSETAHWKHHLCPGGTGAGMLRRGMVRMQPRGAQKRPVESGRTPGGSETYPFLLASISGPFCSPYAARLRGTGRTG